MPARSLDALLDSAILRPRGFRVTYDVDEIRDRLTVAAAFESVGIIVDDTERGECPFCLGGSQHEKSLSIFDDGRGYKCHRGSCGASGDAFSILQQVYEEPWPAIVALAAQLVGVEAAPVDAAEIARRERSRAARRQLNAERAARKRDTSVSEATKRWVSLCDVENATMQRRLGAMADYLRIVRGLPDVVVQHHGWRFIADPRLAHVLVPDERGQPALAVLADDDRGAQAFGYLNHAILGVATRTFIVDVEDDGTRGWIDSREPKVLVGYRHSSDGTFGAPWRVGHASNRCVVVVGVTDFIAAHAIWNDPDVAVLGANGDGRISIPMSVACRRLLAARASGRIEAPEVVLVTDADVSGRAARDAALAVAREYAGVIVRHHDLEGHHDLCDQHAARAPRRIES